MKVGKVIRFLGLGVIPLIAALEPQDSRDKLKKCPGYRPVRHVENWRGGGMYLELNGPPCNVYGKDIPKLLLNYTLENTNRLRVVIHDATREIYQIPKSVFPRPKIEWPKVQRFPPDPSLRFQYTQVPFSFRIVRTRDDQVLFDSSAANIVFEDQYIRLRTSLPVNPNLYGLGEHSDSFRLKNINYTRTMWNIDSPSLPSGWNLHGSHPIYIDHRLTGTHGVFLANSNGMDIVIDRDPWGGYLEYNIIGGVLDLYFMFGESPPDVARQYASVIKPPAMVPYSALGFHQSRVGYQDAFNVAEVVHNYSKADIPLEAMWVDADHMDGRASFSLDPVRFPLSKMRHIADHLHSKNQKLVLTIGPGVAVKDYPPYNNGKAWSQNFLMNSSMAPWEGVGWHGRTVYPDWFAYGIEDYWVKEFESFLNPQTGIDIDFLGIDNEPSVFCEFPCKGREDVAQQYPPPPPPARSPPRALHGWPCEFQPPGINCTDQKPEKPPSSLKKPRFFFHYYWDPPAFDLPPLVESWYTMDIATFAPKHLGLIDRELAKPLYTIKSFWGMLSRRSLDTGIYHYNGLVLYDTHNLYGSMMSNISRHAMIARRPNKRPMVVAHSTFAGSGANAAHRLGENDSSWEHYRLSIRQMLQANAIFQMSMVGSDVCGFHKDTTEELCARWAMLGAFQTFYRNHNALGQIDQEFYRWPVVAKAAKKAIDIRYRLLDYLYTAMEQQSIRGTPVLNPMFYLYPKDENTYTLDLQYFWGPALLVAPVTMEGSTKVKIYFPKDIFYDFYTHEQFFGVGAYTVKRNLTLTDIPLYIRGGSILPMRVKSTMTTAELRKQDFELVVALDAKGEAKGSLLLDDGESLIGHRTLINFSYKRGRLSSKMWTAKYKSDARMIKVTVMGGRRCGPGESSCSVNIIRPLKKGFSVKV